MTEEKLEQRVEGLKLQKNSLAADVQALSQELGSLYLQREELGQKIESEKGELEKLNQDLILTRKEQEQILRALAEERTRIETERVSLRKDREEVEEFLRKKYEEVEATDARLLVLGSKEKEAETRVSQKSSDLQLLEQKRLDRLNQIISLSEEINELNKSLVSLRAERDKFLGDFEQEKKEKEKELKKVQADLEKGIRSLDGIKDNKAKIEKDILRKTKDIQIMEGRLREKYKNEKFRL